MSYASYRFVNKDPVIDLVRTIVQIQASLKNVPFGHAAFKLIEADSGVKAATMANWFFGKTKSPRFATIMAVVAACDKDISVGGKSVLKLKRFKRAA